MGNVPYRIANPDALFTNTKIRRVNFVAYVDDFKTIDGALPVEFTPSREDLAYTDRTKNTLQAIINDFAEQIYAKAQADINKATSHAEAYAKWSHWTGVLGRSMFDDLSYKGDKFKPNFAINAKRYRVSAYRSGSETWAIKEWAVDSMNSTLIITDYPLVLSSTHKKMAKEYAKLKGISVGYLLFTPSTNDSIVCPWITRERFVRWDDLKAALPKKRARKLRSSFPTTTLRSITLTCRGRSITSSLKF
jgi:hypothetical protein